MAQKCFCQADIAVDYLCTTCNRNFCSIRHAKFGHENSNHAFNRPAMPDEDEMKVAVRDKLDVAKRRARNGNRVSRIAGGGVRGMASGVVAGGTIALGQAVSVIDHVIVADLLGIEFTEEILEMALKQGVVDSAATAALSGVGVSGLICAGECVVYLTQFACGSISSKQLKEYSKGALHKAAASSAGMLIGGAVGTVIAPGLGTTIGSAVGGAIGALALGPGLSKEAQAKHAWKKLTSDNRELKDALAYFYPDHGENIAFLRTVTKEDVNAKYRALARVWHPDRPTGNPETFELLWNNYVRIMIFIEGKDQTDLPGDV